MLQYEPRQKYAEVAMAGVEWGGGGGVTSDMFGAKRYNTSERSKDRSQIAHFKLQPMYLSFFLFFF